jgi:hypothetical protein
VKIVLIIYTLFILAVLSGVMITQEEMAQAFMLIYGTIGAAFGYIIILLTFLFIKLIKGYQQEGILNKKILLFISIIILLVLYFFFFVGTH